MEEKNLQVSLKERFEYNGRYYPKAYWIGNDYTYAKNNFIDNYNIIFDKKENGVLRVEAYKKYLKALRDDEILYQSITKEILAKYPILFNDTIILKKARQLNQILMINNWFVENTKYGKLKNDAALNNEYTMKTFGDGRIYSADKINYKKLELDKLVSKKIRLNTNFYPLISKLVEPDKYMESYKKYHDMELSQGLIVIDYVKKKK